MSQETDAALVAEALAGRREAFTALVHRHQRYAYGTALGLLPDYDLAQDVVQESLLCAYLCLQKLKDPQRFGGWLRGIIRYTAHSMLREQGRLRLIADELKATVDAEVPSPDAAIVEAEQRQVLGRALGCLSEKHREVVDLYYLDGMPYKHIAARLEISETTVKGRLQHARARLREELQTIEEHIRDAEAPDGVAPEAVAPADAASADAAEFGDNTHGPAEVDQVADDTTHAMWLAMAFYCSAVGRMFQPIRLFDSADATIPRPGGGDAVENRIECIGLGGGCAVFSRFPLAS